MVQRSRLHALAAALAMAGLVAAPASAQRSGGDRRGPERSEQSQPRPMTAAHFGDCRNQRGWDRKRCEDRRERAWRAHERRERERREKDRKNGAVAGVVGVAIGAAVIGVIASSAKKNKAAKERRQYCLDRYGNYDAKTDSYRASDGRFYPCE